MALHTVAAMINNQQDCIDILIGTTGNLIIKVFSVHGQFIKTIQKTLQDSEGKLSVSLADFSSGNYVANVFKDSLFLHSVRFNKN